jgi:transcriptional regulator with XRE-family HTH domain
MSGQELRQARQAHGWTQKQAAARLGVSQPYVSLLEAGKRPVPGRLAYRLVHGYGLSPSSLPLEDRLMLADNQSLAEDLASLDYPGFAYLRTRRRRKNPAAVLLSALALADCEARVVEPLPWLLLEHELDPDWLVQQARLHNLQNRLGFVVNLARRAAESSLRYRHRVAALQELEQQLEESRLAAEQTLCHASMGSAERRWLRENRPPEAAHWNLLTDWSTENLRYVP